VDLRGGPHRQRLGVEVVEDLAGRAAPRVAQRALDVLGRQRLERRGARGGDLALDARAERAGDRLGRDDVAGARDRQPRRRRAAHQADADVEQRGDGGREVGAGGHGPWNLARSSLNAR
jgi:hypothetical protein